MVEVVIALGANQGDCRTQLTNACQHLRSISEGGFRTSSIWQSEPDGMADDSGTFLNAVVWLKTEIPIESLLRDLQSIEIRMGRPADHAKNVSRPIDLDIVVYGDRVVAQPNLEVPHPRMQLRRFVLLPLKEVMPEFIHPVSGLSIDALIDAAPEMQISMLTQAT